VISQTDLKASFIGIAVELAQEHGGVSRLPPDHR